ncbi:MAG: YceD family protein [Magnetovibrionaceae bacterium]
MRPEQIIALESLSEDPQTNRLKAEPGQFAELANTFGVQGLNSCEAALEVRKAGPLVHVAGKATTDVEQSCVVTLETLERSYEAEIKLTFDTRKAEWPEGEAEVDLSEEAPDAPEPMDGDTIDLWGIVIDELALSIDPFPRAEGADFESPEEAEKDVPEEDRQTESPFAVLADWKAAKADSDDGKS